MNNLNDNDVKEVARMQQLIDKYEHVISSLYIQEKTGKKVEVLLLCKTDLDNDIRYLYRFIEEHKQHKNSLWHSVDEIPAYERKIMLADSNKSYSCGLWTEYSVTYNEYNVFIDDEDDGEGNAYRYKWSDLVKKGFIKWAYIDDILNEL